MNLTEHARRELGPCGRLAMSIHRAPLPASDRPAMAQVGWLGQTGAVYALASPPSKSSEPGSYTPLYMQIGVWVEVEPGTWVIAE